MKKLFKSLAVMSLVAMLSACQNGPASIVPGISSVTPGESVSVTSEPGDSLTSESTPAPSTPAPSTPAPSTPAPSTPTPDPDPTNYSDEELETMKAYLKGEVIPFMYVEGYVLDTAAYESEGYISINAYGGTAELATKYEAVLEKAGDFVAKVRVGEAANKSVGSYYKILAGEFKLNLEFGIARGGLWYIDASISKYQPTTRYREEDEILMREKLLDEVIPFMYVEDMEVVDYMDLYGCISVEAPYGDKATSDAYHDILKGIAGYVCDVDAETFLADNEMNGGIYHKELDAETTFILEFYIYSDDSWNVDASIEVLQASYTEEQVKLMEDNLEGEIIPFMAVPNMEVVDYMDKYGCLSIEAPNGTLELAQAYEKVVLAAGYTCDCEVGNAYNSETRGVYYKRVNSAKVVLLDFYISQGYWVIDAYVANYDATKQYSPYARELMTENLGGLLIPFMYFENMYVEDFLGTQWDCITVTVPDGTLDMAIAYENMLKELSDWEAIYLLGEDEEAPESGEFAYSFDNGDTVILYYEVTDYGTFEINGMFVAGPVTRSKLRAVFIKQFENLFGAGAVSEEKADTDMWYSEDHAYSGGYLVNGADVDTLIYYFENYFLPNGETIPYQSKTYRIDTIDGIYIQLGTWEQSGKAVYSVYVCPDDHDSFVDDIDVPDAPADPEDPVITEVNRSEVRSLFIEVSNTYFGTELDDEIADTYCYSAKGETYEYEGTLPAGNVEKMLEKFKSIFTDLETECESFELEGTPFVMGDVDGIRLQFCAFEAADPKTEELVTVFGFVAYAAEGVDFIDDVGTTTARTEITKSEVRAAFIDFVTIFLQSTLIEEEADAHWMDKYVCYGIKINFGDSYSPATLAEYMHSYWLPGCESGYMEDGSTIGCYLVEDGVYYEVYIYAEEGNTYLEIYVGAAPGLTFIDDLAPVS